MTPKQQQNLTELNLRLADLYGRDQSLASSVVNEALSKAKRLRNRLTVPKNAERAEFVQDFGPTVEFTGRKMFGKDSNDHILELWITLSGEWIVFSSWPDGSRVWTFEGKEREPRRVLEVMGYSIAAKKLAKGMGWDKHLEVE